MVSAREALIGTNRALNTSQGYLESLPEENFSDEVNDHIDRVYHLIPVWKRKLDLLYDLLDQLVVAPSVEDSNAFTFDYKATMTEIDSEMTSLAKVIQNTRD